MIHKKEILLRLSCVLENFQNIIAYTVRYKYYLSAKKPVENWPYAEWTSEKSALRLDL